jgi:GDPmannose 4,6-dehydratase
VAHEQQDVPRDFVIATGEQHSVREFVQLTARYLDIPLFWEGTGVEERAMDAYGKVVVSVDPRYYRATEVETLLGDASRACRQLGWRPQVSFTELVREMAEADLNNAERDALVSRHGFTAYSYHEQ